MDGLELEKYVDYVFKTPSGGILHMKNGAAIIIRGGDAEILSSLEEYHVKYKDNTATWNELTNDQDKQVLYEANKAALAKIRWIDVEAVVAAVQRLEAAELRKSLRAIPKSLLDGVLNFIVSVPWVILVIWVLSFGVKRYFSVALSPWLVSIITGVAAVTTSRCVPTSPGRVAFMIAACGYLLLGLVIWKFD